MPITPRDWADPFLEQAREDLRAAWRVPASESPSTLCMLIQMVFEKLAKAAYARNGQVMAHTHQAASHLFAVLLRHPAGSSILRAPRTCASSSWNWRQRTRKWLSVKGAPSRNCLGRNWNTLGRMLPPGP